MSKSSIPSIQESIDFIENMFLESGNSFISREQKGNEFGFCWINDDDEIVITRLIVQAETYMPKIFTDDDDDDEEKE